MLPKELEKETCVFPALWDTGHFPHLCLTFWDHSSYPCLGFELDVRITASLCGDLVASWVDRVCRAVKTPYKPSLVFVSLVTSFTLKEQRSQVAAVPLSGLHRLCTV